MIPERIVKLVTRLLAPELAKNMERADSAQFTEFTPEHIENFVEVEDRGSDVTIFTFAGLAVLFAGLPAFEFKQLLRTYGDDYNLVLFRDIRRLCYHITPDGQLGGLEFYERHVREALASLGSTYNVAVGVSGGGAAALYFGTRCGFDQVIAFSPGCPLTVYCSPWNQLQSFFDLKRLVTSPKAYVEQLFVTLGTSWSYNRLRKMVGKNNIWSVMDTYRGAADPPRATVFYGEGARCDARQAKLFDGCPNVKRVALPTKFHNSAGYLKRRDELGTTILDEIHEGISNTS